MTRVFIVGEVRLYREGLAQALGQVGVEVVGTEARLTDSISRIHEVRPDVVLIDVREPDGPMVARAMVRATAPAKVVALAIQDVDTDILAWAEAGIAGYVDREGSLHDLAATVESVARGEALCSPRVAAILLNRVGELAVERPGPSLKSHLTAREVEIIRLLGDGLSNKQIARVLRLALPTVKNHVHNILEKLEIHHRAEVTLFTGLGS